MFVEYYLGSCGKAHPVLNLHVGNPTDLLHAPSDNHEECCGFCQASADCRSYTLFSPGLFDYLFNLCKEKSNCQTNDSLAHRVTRDGFYCGLYNNTLMHTLFIRSNRGPDDVVVHVSAIGALMKLTQAVFQVLLFAFCQFIER